MKRTDEVIRQEGASDSGAKEDRKKELREIVDLVLPDGLMIILAFLMIPVAIIPVVMDLSPGLVDFFDFADYTIIAVFVVEYVLKAALARDVKKHVLNPWHLLDLLVIVVPVVDFLHGGMRGLGRSSPLLRLLRVVRIVAIGGRTAKRISTQAATEPETPVQPVTVIKVMDNDLNNVHENVSMADLKGYVASPTHTWVDVSAVSESDFEALSDALGVPRTLLETELADESYPHIGYFEHYSMIFARLAEVELIAKGPEHIQVRRTGLLVVCLGQNIVTVSRQKTDIFTRILERAKSQRSAGDSLVVSILYAVLKDVLDRDEQIISALEHELLRLEGTPFKKLPPDFLETTFHLRKEINQLVPSLRHLREIMTVVASGRLPLEGFDRRDEKIYESLRDRAVYLHETAQNARENLISLIDLYINTTSYQINRVMRVIAVITSLAVVPALIGGLMGMNLIGMPWNMHLWQVVVFVAVIMMSMGWVFYRLGWLKR